jgi:type III secretion protein U
MSDEKTEEPTDKKLKTVREEGQVPKSSDLVEVASLGSIVLVLTAGQHYLAEMLRVTVQEAIDFTHGERSLQDLWLVLNHIAIHSLGLICGVAVVALVAALLALAPQTGFQISMKAVTPKLASISPASGLQRIFSINSATDLCKMVLKASILISVMWQAIKSAMPVVVSALDQSVPQLIGVLWSVLMHVVGIALSVFIFIGVVDYKLQHWLFVRKNRMSKDEVKRESKETDGNPEVKQERKRLAKEISKEGRKSHVSRANVVVVNPVHFAVALRYDPKEFPLPVVLAKGVDEQALALRRQAMHARVPIVANPPVARLLHRVPLDQPIPEELFEVVASILRWVEGLAPRSTTAE